MGKPLSDLLELDDIARQTGLSRQTVRRKFTACGGIVAVAGKAYATRLALPKALGELYKHRLEDIPAAEVSPDGEEDCVTVAEMARQWSVSGNSVRSSMQRLGLGVFINGRWVIPKKHTQAVRAGILKSHCSLRTKKGQEVHAKALEIAAGLAGIRPPD